MSTTFYRCSTRVRLPEIQEQIATEFAIHQINRHLEDMIHFNYPTLLTCNDIYFVMLRPFTTDNTVHH